jgi:hypothetical protein
MKKYGQCVFLVVLFLAFLGCDIGFSHPIDLPSTGTPPNNPPPTGNLPIKTIGWERGTDGFFQFYTNDSQNLDSIFSCLVVDNYNPNIFEIEIKKISGDRNQPYGMIFCVNDSYNLYYVNIKVDGYYEIGKWVNGYTATTGWSRSSRLRTGYNVPNTIRVTKSGSNFLVSFNGSPECKFDDSTFSGGGFGAWAWVGLNGEESFPNTPVDVRFR